MDGVLKLDIHQCDRLCYVWDFSTNWRLWMFAHRRTCFTSPNTPPDVRPESTRLLGPSPRHRSPHLCLLFRSLCSSNERFACLDVFMCPGRPSSSFLFRTASQSWSVRECSWSFHGGQTLAFFKLNRTSSPPALQQLWSSQEREREINIILRC